MTRMVTCLVARLVGSTAPAIEFRSEVAKAQSQEGAMAMVTVNTSGLALVQTQV